MREAEQTYRIKLMGDSGVGKSCLLLRYVDDTYTDTYISTIGVDFKVKTAEHIAEDGSPKVIKQQIFDTQGQVRAHQRGISGVAGVIIAFDITDEISFTNTAAWLSEAERSTPEGTNIILVGTKSDLSANRQVSHERAHEFASRRGITYIECSAKTGVGVEQVFDTMAREIMQEKGIGAIEEVHLQGKAALSSIIIVSNQKGNESQKRLLKETLPDEVAGLLRDARTPRETEAAKQAQQIVKETAKTKTSKTRYNDVERLLERSTDAIAECFLVRLRNDYNQGLQTAAPNVAVLNNVIQSAEQFIVDHNYMSREMQAEFRAQQGRALEKLGDRPRAASSFKFAQQYGNESLRNEATRKLSPQPVISSTLPGSSYDQPSTSTGYRDPSIPPSPHPVPDPRLGQSSVPPILSYSQTSTSTGYRDPSIPPSPHPVPDPRLEQSSVPPILSYSQTSTSTGYRDSSVPPSVHPVDPNTMQSLYSSDDTDRPPSRIEIRPRGANGLPPLPESRHLAQRFTESRHSTTLSSPQVDRNTPSTSTSTPSPAFDEEGFEKFLTNSKGQEIKDACTCKITLEVMKNPVILAGDGNTYEKEAVEQWLKSGKTTSPTTGKSLNGMTMLIENHGTRSMIMGLRDEFVQTQQKQQETGRSTDPSWVERTTHRGADDKSRDI